MRTSQDYRIRIVCSLIIRCLCITVFQGAALARDLVPNPQRAVVSADLEEPWEIYKDGGFETGDHDIRSVSPLWVPMTGPGPVVQRVQDPVYAGQWAYQTSNNGLVSSEFSVWVNPDKAEDIVFTCFVRSDSEPCTLIPFILFEDGSMGEGPISGEAYTIDTTWTQVSFTVSTTHGFRYAHIGIQVPPQTTLYVDNLSVTVPVWKEPEPTGTVVGGVRVPAVPVAPVNLCFSMHIEDPQNLVSSESFFRQKTAVFHELAGIFHAHGGYLNIQPELEWALASELYAPSILADLAQNYDVTYSTHTHGPVCKGPDGIPYGSAYCQDHPDYDRNITEADIADYIQIRQEKFEDLSGIPVSDHNGNFDMVHKNKLYPAGVRTLSVYKNKNTQKSYDYLYTNPWRPSDADGLTDLETFLTHDPQNELVYIPGYGSNLTKRHERVELKVRRFAGQFIQYAEAERVNVMNLVLHVDAFQSTDPDSDLVYIQVQGSGTPSLTYSNEFLAHLQYWNDMLENTIDPLVQAGYLQWATHADILENYLAWEVRQTVADSIFTYVPSNAAGEEGIATLIRLPDQARYSGTAPVAVHVLGGWEGEMLSAQGADLTDQGFVVLFFNFPGSGLSGMQSGGRYDKRGPQCITALRDVVRFAMGQVTDRNSQTLSDLCGSIRPDASNVGLVGWSNGGNATLAAAGSWISEFSNLAWIVNWESPVGDGMPTTEAGGHGSTVSGNPEVNPAYNPDTGEWSMNLLKYDSQCDINRQQVSNELYGGFYFDINHNDIIDTGIDFVPLPITMADAGTTRAYYSERITQYAWNNGLFPANPPDHLTRPSECADFWRVRNSENWFDEIGSQLGHLKFIIVASAEDHAQEAPDYPHVLIQYDGLLNQDLALVRVNADRVYVSDMIGHTPEGAVDNPANIVFDHISIRNAVQPEGIPGLNQKVDVAAACCELADRTKYGILDPQLDEVITGSSGLTGNDLKPDRFSLACFPNPFNPEISILFTLPHSVPVSITAFDLLGRRVDVLKKKDTVCQAGAHRIKWNAAEDGISSGLYFIRFDAGDYRETAKVVFVE